jgi:hypothetical protein
VDANINIFCSYSHKDQAFLDELRLHLTPLQRQGLINLWNDSDITPGGQWEDEINNQLRKAQIILLLISPDFMASDYCYSVELKQSIERHQRREVRVIPIILRPTHWEVEPLRKLLALPKNAEPITLWENRDAAFLDVVQGISRAINELAMQSPMRPFVNPEQPRIRREPFPRSQIEDDLLAEDKPILSPIRPIRRASLLNSQEEDDLLTKDESILSPIRPIRRASLPFTQQTYPLQHQADEDNSILHKNINTWIERIEDMCRAHKHTVMISITLISLVIILIAFILFEQNTINSNIASYLIISSLLLFFCSLIVYLYSLVKGFILTAFHNHPDEDEF